MKKLSVLAVAAALAATLATPTSANGTPEFHTCGGHIDAACTEPGPGGALCTVWLNFRCLLGIV